MIPIDEIDVAVTPNPLLEELWKIRETHAAKFQYDLAAIVRDLQNRQRDSGRTIIYAPTRTIPPALPEPLDAAATASS